VAEVKRCRRAIGYKQEGRNFRPLQKKEKNEGWVSEDISVDGTKSFQHLWEKAHNFLQTPKKGICGRGGERL